MYFMQEEKNALVPGDCANVQGRLGLNWLYIVTDYKLTLRLLISSAGDFCKLFEPWCAWWSGHVKQKSEITAWVSLVRVFSDVLVAFPYFDICHYRQSNLGIENPEFSQPVVAGHFQWKIW